MGDERRDKPGEKKPCTCPQGGYSIFLDEGAMLSFMEEGDFSSARDLDHFRGIEAQLEKRIAEGRGFSIVALSVDGKRISRDFAVVHIAHILAMHGRKVLVTDCDFLEPGLSGFVASTEEMGFLDIMLYGSSLKSAVRPSGIDGVSVIGPGSFPVSKTVPFALKEFAKTKDFLTVTNDVVIFCSTLYTEDGAVNPLSSMADMLLICCRMEEMEEGQLEKNLQALGPDLPPADLICFSVGKERAPAVPEARAAGVLQEQSAGDGAEEPEEGVQEEAEPQYIEKSGELEIAEKHKGGGINMVRIVLIAFSTLAVVFIVWWLFVVRSARDREGQEKMTELVQKQQDARKLAEEGGADSTAAAVQRDIGAREEAESPAGGQTAEAKSSGGAQGDQAVSPQSKEEAAAGEAGREEKAPETATPAPEGMYFSIHVASFQDLKRVGNETEYLEGKGYNVRVKEAIVQGKQWFRVYVGEFRIREDAEKMRLELLSDNRIGYAMIVRLKYDQAN